MKRKPKSNEILATVADYFNINAKDIMGRRHARTITYPRQIVCYLIRKHREDSLTQIGRWLNRDHTTILHSCRVIEDGIKSDSHVRDDVENIEDIMECNFITIMREKPKPLFDFGRDNVAARA